jgi:hypothetical protein
MERGSRHVTLQDDLGGTEAAVDDATKSEPTNDNQFAAMVAFAFNVGTANCRQSTCWADFLAEFNVTGAQFALIGKTVEVLDIHCERSVTYRLGRLANGCAFYPLDGHFFQFQMIDDRGRPVTRGIPACLERR